MSLYPPIPSTLPPDAEAYDQDRFVGRQDELKAISNKVKEGLAGYPITQPIVHIWGIGGMGKSWFLRHLPGYLSQLLEVADREGRRFVSAMLDFAHKRFSTWEPLTVAGCLKDIVDQITGQLPAFAEGNPPPEVKAWQAELAAVQKAEGGREATTLADRFVDLVRSLSSGSLLMLLFDSAEVLGEDDMFWLESHVIEPIARTDRVVFVIAGRKEVPRWREFGVRQRLITWELRPFSADETRQQLEKRGCAYLGDAVHALSFGHPYASQVMSRALHEQAQGRPVRPDFEEEHRTEVLDLLGQVEGELLRGVRSETDRDILRTLSALRKFNIEATRFMLGQVLDPQYAHLPKDQRPLYGQRSDAYYLRLFEKLEGTNLVWWSNEQRGYVLGVPFRRIIDLRILKGAAATYRERHEKALRLYEGWMDVNRLDRAAFLVEALYHLANAQLGKPEAEVQQKVDELIRRYLRPGSFTTDDANLLLQLLQRDQELQNHRQVLPKDVYKDLIKAVREHRDGIAGSEPVED